VTLDLIEQVAALRGQVRAVESEWDDMRAQIKKGYQRMEKAHDRAQPEQGPKAVEEPEDAPAAVGLPATSGFMEKLRQSGLAS